MVLCTSDTPTQVLNFEIYNFRYQNFCIAPYIVYYLLVTECYNHAVNFQKCLLEFLLYYGTYPDFTQLVISKVIPLSAACTFHRQLDNCNFHANNLPRNVPRTRIPQRKRTAGCQDGTGNPRTEVTSSSEQAFRCAFVSDTFLLFLFQCYCLFNAMLESLRKVSQTILPQQDKRLFC